MKLKLLDPHFTVCKVPDPGAINWNAPFCFAARTDEECSLVCPEEYAPASAEAREDGWRAMRIEGVLDFSLVGILASVSNTLATQKIPLFAVSTYNTDYVLVKQEHLDNAINALKTDGWTLE